MQKFNQYMERIAVLRKSADVRLKYALLLACILFAVLLCVVQMMANKVLILLCLGVFLALMAFGTLKGVALPLLLFFLPWAAALKINADGTSFYTLALLMITLVSALWNKLAMKRYQWIGGIALSAMTLISKLINGDGIFAGYILFLLLLFLFPFVAREGVEKNSFYELILFFSAGVISAALLAGLFADMPNMEVYINVWKLGSLTRRSGFVGDSNFYSAQISAALAGSLYLLCHEKGKRKLCLVVLSVVLLYCGLLSVSKMFAIVAGLTFVVWFVYYIITREKTKYKVLSIVVVLAMVAVVLSIDVFMDLVKSLLGRLSSVVDFASLTTSRSNAWMRYLRAIFGELRILVFGEGYDPGAGLPRTSDPTLLRAPHNTPIQILYQFGLPGTVCLVWWFICYIRDMLGGKKTGGFWPICILCIGAFLPWCALDMMFFDEFFLIPSFVCAGISMQLHGKKKESEAEK